MEIFGNNQNIRGCFSVFRLDSQAGRGAMLMLPSGDSMPTEDYNDPLLVTGFQMQQQESISFVKTFGKVYSYAFGHEPNGSVLTVNFVGFMISGKQYSGVVGDVLQKYGDNRISQQPKYAKLALGNTTPLRGFVMGMSSQTQDSQTSVQFFGVTLALVEAQ